MKRGHKNSHADLTAKYLRSILHYDRYTGLFTWKVTRSKRAIAGKPAGSTKREKGRIKIGINGKEYMAHRLAYLYIKGRWPEYEVDHEDENQSNNIWNNLRHATPSQNHRNRGPQQNNKTGYKGVAFDNRRKCFIAGVKLYGYRHNLGFFATAEEAYAAYCKAAKRLHGKWAKLH
jgi:hypothetical protein